MKILNTVIEEIKDLFRKRETEKYPEEKARINKEYRGEHIHNKDKCIYCGKCAKACPSFAIRVDKEDENWEVNLGKCLFCGRCEEVCPTDAISFSNNFEMSKKDKEELKSHGYSE